MSGIELKPIDQSAKTNILLPLGKTTIGRGSFFGVADKRVSRNHAILEVVDGTVTVTPIHTNPTFFRGKEGTKMTPLTKDKLHKLKNGDRIALTPDEHIFEIIIDERPIVPQTLSPRIGDTSPVKQTTPPQQKAQDNGKKESDEEEQNIDAKAETAVEGNGDVEPKPTEEDKRTPSVTDDDEIGQKEEKEEAKNGDHDKEEEEEKEDAVNDKADVQPRIQKRGEVQTVVLDGNKEVALPVQRERNLPSWMMNVPKAKTPGAAASTTATSNAATPAKKGRGKAAPKQESDTPKATEKRGRGRPKGSATKDAAEKKTPSKAKSRTRDYDEDDDDYDDDVYHDDDDDEPATKRSKLSRSQRGSTKVTSYAEDNYDDLDDDWVADEMDDDDDGSDWEMDSHSQSQSKKGKGRGRPGRSPRGKRVSPRKAGRRKKYKDFSDDDDDFSEEEVYVPRPTKRRSVTKDKRNKDHDVSDEDEEEEYRPRPTKRTLDSKKTNEKAKRPKDIDISDEDEADAEEDLSSKKNASKKKKLKSCPYGDRCYRKNRAHFDEFCHPGDPDYASHSDENANGDDAEDDDRPECEFGTSCYRKNLDHKKQYKHTKAPGRPKREAAKKGKKKGIVGGNEDDDGPNTYDYDDSFLNDEDSDSPSDPASGGDSDWGPDEENSEDIRGLVREAKGFMKNRKMQKT